MRVAGMIFIVLSAGSVGFQMASNLKKRCMLMQQILISLQVMKNEIVVCRTPLPRVFALMAASVQEPLSLVYSCIAKDMDRNRWVTPYEAVCTALLGFSEATVGDVLLPLAQTLGKYDLDAQTIGIDKAVFDAQAILHTLEDERRLKSRTYRTLGICTGLAVAILLA